MSIDLLKDRIINNLPDKPYCSKDKTASKIRIKRLAIKEPYIQLNSYLRCAWLIFDIDEKFTGGEYAWEKNNLPAPNYVAFTKETRRYHMAYAISPVYTSENARAKPLQYLAAIQRTYKQLLGADLGYVQLITKNPLHEDWHVYVIHNHEFSLSELHDHCGDLIKRDYKHEVELCDYERNVSLFNSLRYHAYAVVHSFESQTSLHASLIDKSQEINQKFKIPLDFKECEGVAKSVANWTWKHRHSIRNKTRKLGLNPDQPLATRQALGVMYVHDLRREKTKERIIEAKKYLQTQQAKVTQKDVAEHLKIGICTVKRHWKST